MYVKATRMMELCYEENRRGNPQFRELPTIMEYLLRMVVGPRYWEQLMNNCDQLVNRSQAQTTATAVQPHPRDSGVTNSVQDPYSDLDGKAAFLHFVKSVGVMDAASD